MKENIFDQTDWNMSEAFLIRLDKLLGKADELAVEGNFLGVFRVLKRVYVNVLWKLDKNLEKWGEKKKELDDNFEEAEKDLKGNLVSKNLHLVEKTLFKINHILNIILFEENMLYIEKNRKTYQDEIKEAFM